MNLLLIFPSALVACFGAWLLWAAYQVRYRGRTDLIRLGSRELPGAAAFTRQFSALYVAHAL